MRGTHNDWRRRRRCNGIIPAYAGNTEQYRRKGMISWDHPRVCGEHVSSRPQRRIPPGSSPRMRGTRSHNRHNRRRIGIIPAYAGNTTIFALIVLRAEDHPRVCGEHFLTMAATVFCEGSSPRMRGTPQHQPATCRTTGIIPAYAGNTSDHHPWGEGARDHPRVCGEHFGSSATDVQNAGSSPRMRGTLQRFVDALELLGIIPAYAGNTPRA